MHWSRLFSGCLPFSCALIKGVVGDYVGHHALPLHYLEHLHGLLRLLALLTCTDQDIVGDYIGHHVLPLCHMEHLHALLKLLALLSCTCKPLLVILFGTTSRPNIAWNIYMACSGC